MKAPKAPANELRRLSSLRKLKILDTPAEERFDRITRMAQKLLRTDIALVSLVDAGRQWFKSAQGLNALQTPRDISFCGHAILDDEPFVVSDAREDPRFADNPLVTGNPNIRLYAGRPLHAPDGHRIGTLCVIDSEPRELDQDDLETLDDLAITVEKEIASRVLSAAEEQLRAELAEAKMRASVDPLTRLWNRGAIMELLRRELARSDRNGQSMAVLMVDLDHFKQVNDTHGHAGGDEVLRKASERMRQSVRSYDAVGRYGGEEFIIVLTQCSLENAENSAERIRRALCDTPVELPSGPLDITASIGLWWGTAHTGVTTDLVADAADQALYRAKNAGRNRVVVAAFTTPAAKLSAS